MRRRIVLLLGALLGVLTILTGWLVVQNFSSRAAQELALLRATDTARFAGLSILAFHNDRWTAVAHEMRRFEEVYGVGVAVVDLDGRTVAESRPELLGAGSVQRADVADAVRRALTGAPAAPLPPIGPWGGRDYVTAQPVGADAQTLGAAVTISPIGEAAGAVRDYLVLVVLLGAAGLLTVVGAVALPLGRWVLQPLRILELAARRVAGGDLDHPVQVRHAAPELRSLAESFTHMVDGTRALLSRQDQFVADASHELRNPLTALRLHIEMLGVHLDGAPGAREPMDAAMREVTRLSRITEELLVLARAGAPEGGAESVQLDQVLRRTVQRWAGRLPDLEIDAVAAIRVQARPQAVERVLDTLLENVHLHAAPAPVVVRVRAVTAADEVPADGAPDPAGPSREAAWGMIEVADRGPGLNAAELSHVLTRFWRSAGSANRPGSGLGMAIADQLVAGSGGSLAIASNDPSGLIVRTWWPIAGHLDP